MRILLLFMVVSTGLTILSCSKEVNDAGKSLNGTYKGTFKRYHQGNGEVSEVTLVLDYPNWSGSSSIAKYPALNQGTFSYDDYILSFRNTSVWTAEFDWTFILNGNYQDSQTGDSLIFTRSYGNGAIDVYKLEKQ
jgi:hypothetical protein